MAEKVEVLTASMSVAVCAPGLTTQDNKLLSPSPSLSLSHCRPRLSADGKVNVTALAVLVTATGLRSVIWVTGLKDEGCPERPDVTPEGTSQFQDVIARPRAQSNDESRGVRWVGGPLLKI